MLHKVLNGRKVCVFGKNHNVLQVVRFDLFLGGIDVSSYVYHQIDGIKVPGFKINNFKDYAFKSDEYYIVIADKNNYADIRKLLIDNGYEPVKDFIQFCPVMNNKKRDFEI